MVLRMFKNFSGQTARFAHQGEVGGRCPKIIPTFLVLILAYAPAAWPHEYWLSPIAYQVDVGKKMLVDVRNGDNFVGSSLPYQQSKFVEVGLGITRLFIHSLSMKAFIRLFYRPLNGP